MLKHALVLILCAALPATAVAGGYGSRHHFGAHYHHRHHGGDGGALLAGLVIGGLAGYLISEDRHYRRRAYPAYRHDYYSYDYYPRRYRPYHRRGYYDYGYRSRAYREYVPVRPASRRIVVRQDPAFAGRDCRMTREYTTTLDIDGQPREAYGTKCLTADGSWVLGRPRIPPEFD